jgi:hypothetical protein
MTGSDEVMSENNQRVFKMAYKDDPPSFRCDVNLFFTWWRGTGGYFYSLEIILLKALLTLDKIDISCSMHWYSHFGKNVRLQQ